MLSSSDMSRPGHPMIFQPAPLSESTFYILLSLAPGPRHGYAIIQEVEILSSRRLRLSTGTLFGALKRLSTDGWVEQLDEANAPRGRKSYRLTPTGRTMLQTEYRRLRTLVDLARQRLQEA
jgi:DNA-binding PadR family transcriptional regulator